ncbi:MAG TPA: FliA/WhiG family RNA polymerase sigma factor [Bryobacteraceae bacterium]|jgi:RNA polymerase sigma factor for flagellar operon FliA|nr:FliA/WhiG family RNA polymerase sigma factor [Bryobacteraceae bacterium]
MYSYQAEDTGAAERERLILENLPQVRLIARRIHARLPESVSLEDLISTGIIGLISAIDHFDPQRNVKLKTYAEHKIRGAILDSLRDLDWAPRARRKQARQIEAAILAAGQRYHREPTEEEIAAELKLDLDEYQKWLGEVQGLDLESLEYGEQGQELLQFVCDNEEHSPARLMERSELERLLAEAIAGIPKIEQSVLGLYYQEDLSLREITQVMGLPLSRVAQLKTQAVLRLRTYIQKRWTLSPVEASPGASVQSAGRRL